jgi:haloacetate dehalogenase
LPERLIGADPSFYLDRTLAEWCRQGIGSAYDVLAIWRREAETVHGQAHCGHFLAEERPVETATELIRFLER